MTEQQLETLRQRMLMEIAAKTIFATARLGKAALHRRVVEVMGQVPRHEFVPYELQPYAYADMPLPIGCDKTISQPFIVAVMTDLLDIGSTDTVLEVGTGLGYQSAVLSRLARRVYSIELIEQLGADARYRLHRQGYDNVDVRIGNGARGLAERAPFDRIIVTAAPRQVPLALLDQLKPGGRMVIPAGAKDEQQLMLVRKDPAGVVSMKSMLPVRFSALEEPEFRRA
jgi:protein-L-isoaspartate(D-aspartate) O-methyltransferase